MCTKTTTNVTVVDSVKPNLFVQIFYAYLGRTNIIMNPIIGRLFQKKRRNIPKNQ